MEHSTIFICYATSADEVDSRSRTQGAMLITMATKLCRPIDHGMGIALFPGSPKGGGEPGTLLHVMPWNECHRYINR